MLTNISTVNTLKIDPSNRVCLYFTFDYFFPLKILIIVKLWIYSIWTLNLDRVKFYFLILI